MPENNDFVHSEAEALWELGVPLDAFWEQNDAEIPMDLYWSEVEKRLVDLWPMYIDRVPTHFLEGWPKRDAWSRLQSWQSHEILSEYYKDLVETLN